MNALSKCVTLTQQELGFHVVVLNKWQLNAPHLTTISLSILSVTEARCHIVNRVEAYGAQTDHTHCCNC